MALQSPRIDHVLINVNDKLDEAAKTYARLGFTLTPRGHHSLGSSNHLAVFEQDYIELLGYEPQNAVRAAGLWGNVQGLAALVFKTTDADALVDALKTRGVALMHDGAQRFHRPVELTDGTQRDAKFSTVHLDPSLTPSGRLFFCQHFSPELVWHEPWQQHANQVYAIDRVVIASKQPEAGAALLRQVFGQENLTVIEGGARLTAGKASVDYISIDNARTEFGSDLHLGEKDADRKVALVLLTHSLQATIDVLRQNAVTFVKRPDGVLIPASEAAGVTLLIREFH